MSLHQLAHHVQSAGRGDDKVLVHMTPQEVGGLQALAMAHGGSLTINPQTGLPEAGFLSRLLPMIAGFALGPGGFALMSPMQAALTVGAVGTAATGSLGKGLMMGLGAYGGAGLGAGIKAMGTPAVPPTGVYGTPVVSAAPTSTLGGSNIFAKTGAVDITANPMANLPVNTASTTPYAFKSALTTAPPPVVAPPPAPVPSAQAFDIPSRMGGYAQSAVTPTREMAMATTPPPSAFSERMTQLGRGLKASTSSMDGLKALYSASEAAAPYSGVASLGSMALGSYYDKLDQAKPPKQDPGMIRPYKYERTQRPEAYGMGAPMYAETPGSSAERNYFTDQYTALTPYKAPGPEYAAEGGLMGMAVGGPVEQMAAMNSVGANMQYPMAGLATPLYSNPAVQRPEAVNVISPSAEPAVGMYSGEAKFAEGGTPETKGEYKYSYDPKTMAFTQLAAPSYVNQQTNPLGIVGRAATAAMNAQQSSIPPVGTVTGGMAPPVTPATPSQPIYTSPVIPAYQTPEQQLGLEGFYPMMEKRLAALGAAQGYAGGGLSHLGDYSDGGRLLKGPGDGVSDSIPAVIGNRQPARLADGEFVVPARIVSELGNGSTEAGARKLYAMMDRVQKARRKTVGKNKVAANTRSEKYLPA